MRQYLDMLQHVLNNGTDKSDRTGTGTRSVFGYQTRYDLRRGFPLLTTKKLHTKSIIHELLWFLQGDTNVRYLQENGVKIWDEWADDNGDLGPVYGKQWRSWPSPAVFVPDSDFSTGEELDNEGDFEPGKSIDQISNLLHMLRTNPDSRRLIVSAWNPAEVDQMALPPCHCLFQFYTAEIPFDVRRQMVSNNFSCHIEDDVPTLERLMDRDGVPRRYLDCQLYQRSADVYLGVPFNIASYALLTHMIAHTTNMVARDFVHTFGDLHLYKNHFEQANLQLARSPRALPDLRINRKTDDLFGLKFEDLLIDGYHPHSHIAAPVSV